MARWLRVMLALVLAVGLGTAVYAGECNDCPDPPAVYPSNDTVEYTFIADARDFAVAIKAKTEGTYIAVEVADCCIEGDVWRGIIWKGKNLATTSSQDADGVALPPKEVAGEDAWSTPATVDKRRAFIFITAANNLPGGISAGMYVRITSDGILTTKIKSVVGGMGPS